MYYKMMRRKSKKYTMIIKFSNYFCYCDLRLSLREMALLYENTSNSLKYFTVFSQEQLADLILK